MNTTHDSLWLRAEIGSEGLLIDVFVAPFFPEPVCDVK